MTTTISILQGILATAFAASGIIILLFKEKLKPKLSWLNSYSPKMVIFICVSKIVGAIGLVVPSYTGILPVLTPVSAIGIALIMVFAFKYHINKKEFKDMPATILFFLIAVTVAYYKF